MTAVECPFQQDTLDHVIPQQCMAKAFALSTPSQLTTPLLPFAHIVHSKQSFQASKETTAPLVFNSLKLTRIFMWPQ